MDRDSACVAPVYSSNPGSLSHILDVLMIVLGIDLETTSLEIETCAITEVGLVLYDTEVREPLQQFGGLVRLPFPTEIDPTAKEATGITENMVERFGMDWSSWERLISFLIVEMQVRALVAHNHKFDKPILIRHCEEVELAEALERALWIDTMTDIPYPSKVQTRKLEYLCFEHGFFNPFPHRALTDVLSMFKVMSMYDFSEILKLAESPTVWVRALVSYDDRGKAKSQGYRWDSENKFWVKQTKGILLEKVEEEANFITRILPDYVFGEEY